MSKKIKRVSSEVRPINLLSPSKSSNHLKPIFSFEHLDGHDYCLCKCDDAHKLAAINTIHLLSSKSWQELTQAPKHGLGYEKVPYKLPTNAIKPDANVIAFRFYGKAPMLGYRVNEVFYILGFDCDFTAYVH